MKRKSKEERNDFPKENKMIDFIAKYLWWIVMIMVTPIVLFMYIVYLIEKTFEQINFDFDEHDKQDIF